MAKIVLSARSLVEHAGGAEKVMIDTANYLARQEHDVEIWHFDKKRGAPFYPVDPACRVISLFWDELKSPDRTARSIGKLVKASPLTGRLAREAAHGIYRKSLRSRLKSSRPDVAIGYMAACFPYLIEAARGLDIPVVASCHNVPETDFVDPRRWDPNPYDRRKRLSLLQEAAAITVIQPEFAEWFPQSLRARIHVLENPVIATPGQADVGEEAQGNTILAVGRLVRQKRHATLIRSWGRIQEAFPNWVLRICGDGPLKQELEQLVSDLGLEARVELPGAIANIMNEYETSKFLVIPSEYEGFGLVTAEAMLKGLPALGFADCPGTNKLIIDGMNGLLLPGADHEAELAEAMHRLITEHHLRANLAGRAPETVAQFKPETVLPKWEALLNQLAAS